MKNPLPEIWQVIISLMLYALIFYAGAITGITYENRRIIDGDIRIQKLEQAVREHSGKIAALEAITKGIKK